MTDSMSLPEAVRLQLEKRLGPVFFSDLSAHLERDAVFVVRADVDLVSCGVAVATDDVGTVRDFIETGKLRKPSAAERSSWPTEAERQWLAVVVQPFVLVQDAPDPSARDAASA